MSSAAIATDQVGECITYARTAPYREVVALFECLKVDHTWNNICKARMGRADRYYLLTQLLHRSDAYHPWLFDRCREVESEPDECLDLWSRGHYKSTIITFAGIIQEILIDPEITIGIFSHTRGIAKGFLSQVKLEMEQNDELKEIYPQILWADPRKEAPRWSLDTGLVVKRNKNPKESTLDAWGLVDGQPTSKHYRLRVYDDVVTESSVNTSDQIQKTTKAWELSQNLGIPGGISRRWHIGTRYSYGDTWQTLLDREVVKPRVYPATDDGTFDGKPVFLSQAEWDKKKHDESEFTVACQQLQNPIAGGQQELKPEWLRFYELRPKTLNVYILCDYAGSKPGGGSNTAIACVGIDSNLNKYLLDGVVHKLTLSERWATIRDMRKKWLRRPGIQIVEVGYERFGAQSDIEHFETMMQIEKEAFSIKELAWPREGDVSKDSRIRRLEPDFRNWCFYLPYKGEPTRSQITAKQNKQEFLIAEPIKKKNQDGMLYDVVDWFIKNEYLFFPNTTHKDFLDALSRIYDMDISAPILYNEKDLEPEAFDD
jgi:hypothetical protein